MVDYASQKGTKRYKEKIIKQYNLPENHFRDFLGLKLSSLGMGTYLGNLDSKTDKQVINAVIESIKTGINVIDTAINYRYQRAERSIGDALKKIPKIGYNREEIFISSKIGYIPGDFDLKLDSKAYIKNILLKNDIISEDDIIGMNCMSVPYLNHQINKSLENLNLNCIDLLYLHNVADAQKTSLGDLVFYDKLMDAFVFLEGMIQEQKIKSYGIATWDCLRVMPKSPNFLDIQKCYEISLKAANKIGKTESGLKCFMLPYNFMMPEALTLKNQDGKSVFKKAHELNLGLFAAVPIMQGRGLNHPNLKKIMNDLDLKNPVLAALQFIRNVGMPLIAPLIGHKNPEHIKENLELLKIPPKE